jgi:isopropylmalate/homocitrate/citramalate synthase
MAPVICEVGPRDGLQNLNRHLSVAERIELIDRLSATGLARIEAVSFVNDQKVPQMAGAEAVLAGIKRRPGLQLSALVLNARGAERAQDCDLDELRFVVVASETFSQRNQGATIARSLETFRALAAPSRSGKRRIVGVIAASFGCPFEGEVPPSRVVDIAKAMVDAGATEIVLADTIGSGVPTDVEKMFQALEPVRGTAAVGCHFHNTRNMGFANALVALRAGASVLDASIGGLGGCPFAPRATGNIATEDLGFMFRQMGLATPFNLPALIDVAHWLGPVADADLPGLVAKAGLFPDVVRPSRFHAAGS